MNFFKHPQALVESTTIGDNTKIWAFAHVLPGARIGSDCNICDNVFIENDVIIGDRVTIKCGVQVWDGLRLENDVFVGPNATFTNDARPRSKQYPDKFLQTIVKKGASIGANATILPGLIIGTNAMVGAGAVVTKSVPPNAIVVGNPAFITGYAATKKLQTLPKTIQDTDDIASVRKSAVKDVTFHRLPVVDDIRGRLSFAEYESHIPFIPKRFFIVFDVPSREVRGEHAHKELKQFLVCVKGSCSVLIDDGINREEIKLDSPGVGVYIPPLVWGVQYKYSQDAILLVLASATYDPNDYIRDYDDYLLEINKRSM